MTGDGPIDAPRPLNKEPAGTGSRSRLSSTDSPTAYRATGYVLSLIEFLMRSTIHVDGVENIADGPVLFVANHFTRFETFIVPYLIDKYAHRHVHSLAHHSLFGSAFGNYLRSMGGHPTGSNEVKETMIEELLTGRHDWVIYPEGAMIKNKKIWSKGRFSLDSPDRKGPPHTGAAVLGLQAEIYRHLYLEACRTGDQERIAHYQRRFHLQGPGDIPAGHLGVIPITITYYPIRPGKNVVQRLARLAFKRLPAGLDEELEIEGRLLFSETDISFHFGKPIGLDRYRGLLEPALAAIDAVSEEHKVNTILAAFRNRMTNRIMEEIYSRVTINFDHLFANALFASTEDEIDARDLRRVIYLAARDIQSSGRRRSHPSIAEGLVDMLAGVPYGPEMSVRALGEREGMFAFGDGTYRLDRAALVKVHEFDSIRLKNTLAVIANELEPVRPAVKAVRAAVHLSRSQLRHRVADILAAEDQIDFEAEASYADPAQRSPAEVGRPFYLPGRQDAVGIVLSHGYLAAPREMEDLARFLNRLGYPVYVLRLKGHGTGPEQIGQVLWPDWVRSYNRGLALMANRCRQVILGGFSAGGLLSLIAAARRMPEVAAVVAINAPLGLVPFASHLVGAVHGWNKALGALGIQRGRMDWVENRPERPEVNYKRNTIHGMHELERLMEAARAALPDIACPTLLIQGDHDPVVTPGSGAGILAALRCDERELVPMAFDRHVIVNGPGSDEVHGRIAEFINGIADSLRR